MTEPVCPVCTAPGGCPVEGGVTFHRQYPPPPGWQPRLPSQVEAAERLEETERFLNELEAKRPVQSFDALVEEMDALRDDWDR
jgi:hypothetical protein